MRVLVTGSRDIPSSAIAQVQMPVWNVVEPLANDGVEVIIVDGGCPTGADMLIRRLVTVMRNRPEYRSLASETHRADWASYGGKAGPKRNKEMVELGADICFAFFMEGARNVGTTHCAELAHGANIPVRRIDIPKPLLA